MEFVDLPGLMWAAGLGATAVGLTLGALVGGLLGLQKSRAQRGKLALAREAVNLHQSKAREYLKLLKAEHRALKETQEQLAKATERADFFERMARESTDALQSESSEPPLSSPVIVGSRNMSPSAAAAPREDAARHYGVGMRAAVGA